MNLSFNSTAAPALAPPATQGVGPGEYRRLGLEDQRRPVRIEHAAHERRRTGDARKLGNKPRVFDALGCKCVAAGVELRAEASGLLHMLVDIRLAIIARVELRRHPFD